MTDENATMSADRATREAAETAALAADQAALNSDTGAEGPEEAPPGTTEAINDRPTPAAAEEVGRGSADAALAAGAAAGIAPDALAAAATAANSGAAPVDPVLTTLQGIMARLSALEEGPVNAALDTSVIGRLVEGAVDKAIEGLNQRLAALEANAVEHSSFLMKVAEFFGLKPPAPPAPPTT